MMTSKLVLLHSPHSLVAMTVTVVVPGQRTLPLGGLKLKKTFVLEQPAHRLLAANG